MPGRVWEKAFDRATEQYGFLTHADMRELGEDPTQLRLWRSRGHIERVGHGIYRFPQIPTTALDPYMLATLWPAGRGVISHDSALELHALCDINPVRIHLSVPAGYRLRRQGGALYEVHRIDLGDEEVTLHEGIRVTTAEATIRHGLEAHIPAHLLDQALEKARKTGLVGKQVFDVLRAELARRS